MTETLSRPASDGTATAVSTPTPAAKGVLDPLASFQHLTYWYPGTGYPALSDIDLTLDRGLTLVVGDSASGKSSLLRVLNGLVPHFHGGRIRGGALVLRGPRVAPPTPRGPPHGGGRFHGPHAGLLVARRWKK